MPKVSIIIPVYKAEKYIEKCARSLFEQTLDDIEYIFVNDCTPDGSISVLRQTMEDYPKRLESVKIIDLPVNGGQAKARKIGIEAASGDYIIHCDSDDWVDTDMYRLMYEKAEEDGLDVVICDYFLTDGKDHRYWGQHYTDDPIKGLLINWLSSSTCNKLAKRAIFTDYGFIFPERNICEDFVYNIQYFIYGPKVGYIDKALYYYYRHSDNSTNTCDESKLLKNQKQIVENVSMGLGILEQNNLSDKNKDSIIHQKVFVKNNLLPIIKNHHREWLDTFREVNSKVIFCSSMSFKEKALFYLAWSGLYPIYKSIKG